MNLSTERKLMPSIKHYIRFCFVALFLFTGLNTQAQTMTRAEAEQLIQSVKDSLNQNFRDLSATDIQRLKELESQARQALISLENERYQEAVTPEVEVKESKIPVKPTAKPNKKKQTTSMEESEDWVYGLSYLRDRDVSIFNSALDVKPPDNYIIGPGDEISVNIWGYSDYNQVFTVEKEGFITPRFIGRIYIKGLTVSEAKKVLESKFDRIYDMRNSKFDISINYSRVIRINVAGEAMNPGSYTLPAVNAAFNVLSYVGGPSDIGSIRNVQIKRDGEVVNRFDLYRYLFFPEQQSDIFLQNNDYLFVPVARKTVTVTGAIKRPGKYELLDTETWDDLLVYSAGYLPTSFTGSVQIKRYENNKVFIFDVNLDSLKRVNGVLPLMNGDEIRVREIAAVVDNYLEVLGPVELPGRYQFRTDMRVSDLIAEAGGLKEDVFAGEAYLTRTRDDLTRYTIKLNLKDIIEDPGGEADIPLQKRDELEMFSSTYFYDAFQVSITGAVRNPRSFPLQEGMTVRDLIKLAGGLERFAYLERGYITRRNSLDSTTTYLSFDVDTSNNLLALDQYAVQANDEVNILSYLDFVEESTVEIKGGVRNPGTYELWRDLSLKDFIIISGGLLESAYLPRAYIYRTWDDLREEIIAVELDTTDNMAALDEVRLRKNDVVEIFAMKNYELSFPIEVNGSVRQPGVFVFRKNTTLADALILAGGLKYSASNKRIEIARIANFEESVMNDTPLEVEIIKIDISVDVATDPLANSTVLRPFDQVYVREAPGFDFQEKVMIEGEVLYPGLYVLKDKDERLMSLIDRAGGLTEYAFPKGARLVREEDKLGKVIMDLERAERRPRSKYNYIIKEGDEITIPRMKDLVTVTGKIAYPYIDADSTISGAHTSGKRAKYYIKQYGTGFTKQSRKKDTYVVYANGEVKQTKHFWGLKFYPKVEQGATVYVPPKLTRRQRKGLPPKDPDKRFDGLRFTEILLSTTTSALTVYLLIDRTRN